MQEIRIVIISKPISCSFNKASCGEKSKGNRFILHRKVPMKPFQKYFRQKIKIKKQLGSMTMSVFHKKCTYLTPDASPP